MAQLLLVRGQQVVGDVGDLLGSYRKAQDRVAVQTSEMVLEALRGSIFVSAVNLPFEGLSDLARGTIGSLAMAIITVDSRLDPETLSFLRSFREMKEVKLVKL